MTGLPDGWRELALSDVADTKLGKMLDKGKPRGAIEKPYLRNINVRWGSVDTADVFTMMFGEGELERYGLKEGDVLVCEGGEPGRVAVWDGRIPDMKYQKALHRVRPNPDLLLPRFLMLQLTHDAGTERLDKLFTGTTIKHLTGQALSRYQVRVAPLDQQRRIVAKLDALFERSRRAKAALDAVPPLLDKLRQSILAAAFRGDLTRDWRTKNPDVEPASKLLERIRIERRRRWEEAELEKMRAKGKEPKNDKWKEKYVEPEPVDTTGLPELPEGWVWASADELVTAPIIYGIIKAGPHYPDGVPYVRVTEVAANRIVLADLPRCNPLRAAKFSRSTLRAGDMLVSKDGTIGKVAFVPPELEGGNINQHVLRVRSSRQLARQFFARMIEAPASQSWMTGETRGIALRGVNVEDFRRLPIPLAPATEQRAAARAVDAAWSMLAAVNNAHRVAGSRAASLEASLLAKAFRARL